MLLSVIIFAVTMCITPGPNNIMLTASGANFGFRRTIPHILGVEFGMLFLFALSALGLGVLFVRFPVIHTVIRIAGACYLLYLALRIIFARRKDSEAESTKPLNIFQAAAFQLLNPKAYVITISGVSAFTKPGEGYAASAFLLLFVFAVVCIPCISLWAGFGNFISRFLKNDRVFRVFNVLMGCLTAGSVVLIIL
ncbi:MAG: LysE family translocator [Spirochaetales bacterium]|nr:LysE family translocator [Spirochaetales bacterium]